MYYYWNKSFDCYYNLALEEFLTKNRKDEDITLIWQNKNTIVIGANQNVHQEINQAQCEANNVSVVRRISGGGAVYHDFGNINFSFITTLNRSKVSNYAVFTSSILNFLRNLGVNAEFSGRNDLTINGRKISGNAQAIVGKNLLHHGTLMFNVDSTKLNTFLKPNIMKLRTKGISSVKSRVTNIIEHLPQPLGTNDFLNLLNENLSRNTKKLHLSASDQEAVHQLREKKYIQKSWNWQKNSESVCSNIAWYDAGIIELQWDLENQKIQNLNINGDFLAKKPLTKIIEKLNGTDFNQKAVLQKLEEIANWEDYFGKLEIAQVVATFGLSTK